MKTITEIFKDKPELLNEPEVKELIDQFKIQFQAIKNKHHNYWDKVTELTMNSDLFVIDGIPVNNVIKQINSFSFDVEYISC